MSGCTWSACRRDQSSVACPSTPTVPSHLRCGCSHSSSPMASCYSGSRLDCGCGTRRSACDFIRRQPPRNSSTRRTRKTIMPIILLLLAGALAANVLLGPLGFGLIQWHVSANGLNQTYGADGASLLLVVPAALAAARLWQQHRRLASRLALGVGLATLYYAIAEVLGADYVRYPGNNERFFLLFLNLIILSWITAARAWSALDDSPPAPSRWLRRALGVVMLLGGGLIGLAWTAQLVPIALT